MSITELLAAILLICVVSWASKRILAAFGIGDPLSTIVHVALVLIMVLWVLSALGFGTGLRLR